MTEDEILKLIEDVRTHLPQSHLEKGCLKARKALQKLEQLTNADHDFIKLLIDCLGSPCFLLRYDAIYQLKYFADDYFVRSAIIERLPKEKEWYIIENGVMILSRYIELDTRIVPLFVSLLTKSDIIVLDKLVTALDPYIDIVESCNASAIIENCLTNEHLLPHTIEIILKHALNKASKKEVLLAGNFH